MSEAKRLADWMEEQASDRSAGTVTKLVVAHVIKGNKLGDEIRTVTVPPHPDETWIADTAGRLVEQAASEAVVLGNGIQRYAVLAYFDGGEKPRARHVFTCAGADEEGAIGTEGPDSEGLVAASMRHTQFFAALATKSVHQQMQNLMAENKALREELERMRKERLETFAVMEEVYSQRATRAGEERRDRVKTKILEDSAEKVQALIPIALNHLAGKKIFPEAVANEMLLRQFVGSITPDDLMRMSQALSPEKMALLIQLGTSVARMKPEEAGAASATPAEPAAGTELAADHVNGVSP